MTHPHFFTDTIMADDESFLVQFEDAVIEANPCSPLTTDERFSLDFVLVNSQIYRNSVDKNVNYFNQSFIDVNVQTRDLSCVSYENLQGIHPMLENLKSIHFYGSKDRKVTWYFEM